MNCDYGCGEPAKYEFKNGKNCCSKNVASCSAVNKKRTDKLKESYKNGTRPIKDTFGDSRAWNRGKTMFDDPRVGNFTQDDIFSENSSHGNEYVKKIIIKHNLIEYKCRNCGLTEWDGKPIVLHLEHKNGINRDNRLDNLEFLCPNCHSQTDTYCGKNKNQGSIKISDDVLVRIIKESTNTRQALLKAGLAAKGGNYNRIKILMAKHGLSFK